jgi:hypothetical protein
METLADKGGEFAAIPAVTLDADCRFVDAAW